MFVMLCVSSKCSAVEKNFPLGDNKVNEFAEKIQMILTVPVCVYVESWLVLILIR